MVDYSKWSKIEVSDDEDDTHPNIDTGSLFRWRHKARVERMDEFQIKKQAMLREKSRIKEQLNDAMLKYEQGMNDDHISGVKLTDLKQTVNDIKTKYDEIISKEADLLHEEKNQPWNIDTICQMGFDSSIVGSYNDKSNQNKDEYEGLTEFLDKYKTEIETFGMLSDNAESRSYLLGHTYLVCNHTASYLCLWCIDLAVLEKWALFDIVTKQAISMQFLLELAKTINVPRNRLVNDFYANLNKNIPEYTHYFNEELNTFKERAKNRAQERIQEQMEQLEQEEREKRLGPGGLDPQEVLEQLPEELRECFVSRDIDMLKATLTKMDLDKANRYMKMCIDSGLWVPNKDDDISNTTVSENE